MNSSSKWFIGFSALLSDITFMFCGYVLFTTLKADKLMKIEYIPWVLVMLAIYIISKVLVKKQVRENTYMTSLIIMGVIALILGNMFFIEWGGITSLLFANLFIVITVGRCYLVAKNGIIANQMLVYVEFSIMLLCFILMVEKNISEIRGVISSKFLISTTCNLISLILIRVGSQNSMKYNVGKFKGVFLFATILAIAGTFAAGFMIILSDGFARFMTLVVDSTVGLIRFIFDKLLEFLIWFFSLFSVGERTTINVAPAESMGEIIVEEGAVVSDKIFIVLGIIAIAAIVVVFIKIYISNKNKKISPQIIVNEISSRETKVSIWKLFKSFIKRIYSKFIFFVKSIKYRNTIEGVYIKAISFGAKNKMVKHDSESIREFLVRISAVFEDENKELIENFISKADEQFYSNNAVNIEKKDIKVLRRILSDTKFSLL